MGNSSQDQNCKAVPLPEQKTNALNHYDELARKANHWNSEIPKAIRAFYNEKIQKESPFQKELEGLLNKYSQENASNTPDFILAEYLGNCLHNYNTTVAKRDDWNTSDSEESQPETVSKDKTSIELESLLESLGPNIKKAFLTGTIHDGNELIHLHIINKRGGKQTFLCEPVPEISKS